jgi:hypothetical protein
MLAASIPSSFPAVMVAGQEQLAGWHDSDQGWHRPFSNFLKALSRLSLGLVPSSNSQGIVVEGSHAQYKFVPPNFPCCKTGLA